MVIMIDDPDLSFSSQQDSTYHKVLSQSTRSMRTSTRSMRGSTRSVRSEPIMPRRVSFQDVCMCYDVMSLDDYSPDEVKSSWYSVQEYVKIRGVLQSQIKQLEAGNLGEAKVRGLEHRTKKGIRRKKRCREGAYFAVFSEIDIQKTEEIVDEGGIADAYRVHSKHAAAEALKAAKKDAYAALKIYRKTFKDRVLVNGEQSVKKNR